MGHFQVSARLTGPTGLSEDVELFVDTGFSSSLGILPIASALSSVDTRASLLPGEGEKSGPLPKSGSP